MNISWANRIIKSKSAYMRSPRRPKTRIMWQRLLTNDFRTTLVWWLTTTARSRAQATFVIMHIALIECAWLAPYMWWDGTTALIPMCQQCTYYNIYPSRARRAARRRCLNNRTHSRAPTDYIINYATDSWWMMGIYSTYSWRRTQLLAMWRFTFCDDEWWWWWLKLLAATERAQSGIEDVTINVNSRAVNCTLCAYGEWWKTGMFGVLDSLELMLSSFKYI